MKRRVWVLDDEPRMAQAAALALSRDAALEVRPCTDPQATLQEALERPPEVLVSDWRMPGLDGLELMRRLHEAHPGVPVIIMTAFGDVPSAVDAIKRGAFDYLTKPFDNDELRALVARALDLEHLRAENRALRAALARDRRLDRLVASSPKMRAVLDLVARAAPSDAPVLVTGESGTGKELVARLVHHDSARVAGPFVAVNVEAFAPGIVESELFGHEVGAFTGADRRRAGCFERAHGGTLFLDEIGELSPDVQVKLLRVLQESEVQPLGADAPRGVDVRVVAATHRDLTAEVAAGRFREDLYFRLAVIPVHVPPLRERPEDVLPIARACLERLGRRRGQRRDLSEAAEAALLAHPWRGNVRELENTLERAQVLCAGDHIEPEDLLLGPAPRGAPGETPVGLDAALDAAARRAIEAALEREGGRRGDAAQRLGVDRSTLYRWMKRLGL